MGGELIISKPKTKASVRTVVLPTSMVNVLTEYKKTALLSRWMFPSPVVEDAPRNPCTLYNRMKLILKHAGCKMIRFHDLRHTFATMALERGMDVKKLSALIGHVSSVTTLDIYIHITDTMQKEVAATIERGIGGKATFTPRGTASIQQSEDKATITPVMTKFEPYKGKIRKSGTVCLYQINDHLREGSYSPVNAHEEKVKHNVYTNTREECERLLGEMINCVSAEIADNKVKMDTKQAVE